MLEIKDIKLNFEIAVQKMLNEKPNLLSIDAHELAISHRVAVYLEDFFSERDFNIDCDYNKHLESKKVLLRKDYLGKEFRPDIIIHKRNSSYENLLAVEIKKKRNSLFDLEKLKILTGEHGYTLGVYVFFGGSSRNEPVYKWFQNGEIINL